MIRFTGCYFIFINELGDVFIHQWKSLTLPRNRLIPLKLFAHAIKQNDPIELNVEGLILEVFNVLDSGLIMFYKFSSQDYQFLRK